MSMALWLCWLEAWLWCVVISRLLCSRVGTETVAFFSGRKPSETTQPKERMHNEKKWLCDFDSNFTTILRCCCCWSIAAKLVMSWTKSDGHVHGWQTRQMMIKIWAWNTSIKNDHHLKEIYQFLNQHTISSQKKENQPTNSDRCAQHCTLKSNI